MIIMMIFFSPPSYRVDLLSHHGKQVLSQGQGVLALSTKHTSQVEAVYGGLFAVESVRAKGEDYL